MWENIKEQYLLVTVGIPPGDLHLMYKPLEARLMLLTLTKDNWIRSDRIYMEEVSI